MKRLRMTRLMSNVLGIFYIGAALLVGSRRPDPNQVLFTLVVFTASICFAFSLNTHERMNDLRRRGGDR